MIYSGSDEDYNIRATRRSGKGLERGKTVEQQVSVRPLAACKDGKFSSCSVNCIYFMQTRSGTRIEDGFVDFYFVYVSSQCVFYDHLMRQLSSSQLSKREKLEFRRCKVVRIFFLFCKFNMCNCHRVCAHCSPFLQYLLKCS